MPTAYLWKAMEIHKEMCNTEDGKPEELELSCRAKATDEVWVWKSEKLDAGSYREQLGAQIFSYCSQVTTSPQLDRRIDDCSVFTHESSGNCR